MILQLLKNQPELVTPTVKGFERRSLNVLKTIEAAATMRLKLIFTTMVKLMETQYPFFLMVNLFYPNSA